MNLVQTEKKVKKTKSIRACRNGQTGRSWSESCRIQSQDGQELGIPATTTTHIAQTSGVTQSVDLTNKGMGNHYLRDVHGFRTAVCARGPYLWHTSPTRHLKVQNFEDTYEDMCAVLDNSDLNQVSFKVARGWEYQARGIEKEYDWHNTRDEAVSPCSSKKTKSCVSDNLELLLAPRVSEQASSSCSTSSQQTLALEASVCYPFVL